MKRAHLAVVFSAGMIALAGCSAKVGVNATATTSVGSQTTAATTATTGSSPKTGSVSPLLTGTAHPTIPALVSGKVAIIVTGPLSSDGNTVPVMVGNGTSSYISQVDVSGPAVNSSGTVVGSGDSQGFAPQNVAPGQITFGFAYFQSAVPAGSTFQLKVTYQEGQSSTQRDAQVTQANAGTDPTLPSVVGTVTNTTSTAIKNPIAVSVYCFDNTGALTSESGGFTDGNADLTKGSVASYTVDLGDESCPTFLVGASGYSF